jgi:hypothetical protein
MANYILNSSQLSILSKTISETKSFDETSKKWEKLSEEEKKFIVDFLFECYPEKKNLITEASWYNTLGDIVGIFDPTGVVDLVNGISYISQGDNLFGFLSIVSAVPYAGDLVAKPVMGALKIGAPSAKALEGILKASKAAKTPEQIAKVSADLANLSKQGGITGKFVSGMGYVGSKLKSIIERMPGGFLKGLKNTLLQWINLFEKAAVSGKTARAGVGGVASQYGNLAKKVTKMNPLEKTRLEALLSQEIKSIKGVKGPFTGYRTPGKVFSWKNVFGGLPQIMGRNKSVRSLMRQTKWWAGFLDWIGIGNFVGPDEMIKELGGESQFESKLSEYNNTTTAKDLYNQDFPDQEITQQQPSPQQPKPAPQTQEDPFIKILRDLTIGQLNPIPGM